MSFYYECHNNRKTKEHLTVNTVVTDAKLSTLKIAVEAIEYL